MPARKIPLVAGEYYHVFNRVQNKEHVFTRKSDCQRVLITFDYYRFSNPPLKLSYYLASGSERRRDIRDRLKSLETLVDLITFCVMPNHFHILVRQNKDNGISRFLSLTQNSLTKFRNVKYKRNGHLFKGQFKAVRIEDDEQLLHVHRYIHLNPYTAYVVKTTNELANYAYSSLPEYLGNTEGFCVRNPIMDNFRNNKDYQQFIFDSADYHRHMVLIKHLTLE